MTLQTLTKTLCHEELIFTNQRCLFWKRQKALVLSDLHVGKAAYFRKNGIAVPSDILSDDLSRLAHLIGYFVAEEVIVVGDFLHAGKNSDLQIFQEWRSRFPQVIFRIIKGNHDRFKIGFAEENRVEIYPEKYAYDPFTFIHIPEDRAGHFCISGHLHPGITLKLERNKSVSLPCFRYSETQLVLPAFSRFTGLDTKSCGEYHCIPFSENLIFELDGDGNFP